MADHGQYRLLVIAKVRLARRLEHEHRASLRARRIGRAGKVGAAPRAARDTDNAVGCGRHRAHAFAVGAGRGDDGSSASAGLARRHWRHSKL